MGNHWHYMMLELITDDQLIRPWIGEEHDLTREQAHAQVQWTLDRLVETDPRAKMIADGWRRGAKDDWVYYGPFSWTIFECTGPTCSHTFQAVAEDWAATLRQQGLDVNVAQIPGT